MVVKHDVRESRHGPLHISIVGMEINSLCDFAVSVIENQVYHFTDAQLLNCDLLATCGRHCDTNQLQKERIEKLRLKDRNLGRRKVVEFKELSECVKLHALKSPVNYRLNLQTGLDDIILIATSAG